MPLVWVGYLKAGDGMKWAGVYYEWHPAWPRAKTDHMWKPQGYFFLMWTIFKVFIEFVTILFMFYVFVWGPCGMWDLSSPTRHWIHTPCSGRQSLKIAGPPGNFLHSFITRFTKNKWEPPLMAPHPTLRLLLFLETWTLSHKVVG